MIKKYLFVFAVCPLFGVCQSDFGANAETTGAQMDGGLVKVSVFPFLYAALFREEYFWMAVHYEKRINQSANTFQLTIDYSKYASILKFNGVTTSYIPNNTDVWIVPQIRHYFKKQPFAGYYLGAFPAYLFRDHPADTRKGTYFGAGLISGYQRKLAGRFEIELALRISLQGGKTSLRDINGNMITQTDVFPWLVGELNIGFFTKRKK